MLLPFTYRNLIINIGTHSFSFFFLAKYEMLGSSMAPNGQQRSLRFLER